MSDIDKTVRDRPMSLIAHLTELRHRLRWALLVGLIGFGLAIAFYHPIFQALLIPAQGLLSPDATPIVTSPTEFMGATIVVGIMSGLILALPILIYEIIMFVAPAISPKTQTMLLFVMPLTLVLFAAGVTMGYVMVLPTMFKFLLTYGDDVVTPMIRLSDYLNLVVVLLSGIGLAFETPLVMVLLAKLGVLSYKTFRRFERWMIVLAFVIGAIFDPSPNPFDQIVVAGTIITLYNIGILLAWLVQRHKVVETSSEPSPG